MKNNKYKIDLEIFVVFLVVVGISVFNAIFSTSNLSTNQKYVNDVMETEIPSLQQLEEMRLVVNQSVMYTTRRVYLPNNFDDKQKFYSLLSIDYPKLKGSLVRLSENWRTPLGKNQFNMVLNEFDTLIADEKAIMELLGTFEDYENPEKHFKAQELLENKIIPYSKVLSVKLNDVITLKQSEVDKLHLSINSSSRSLLLSIQAIAILIILIIVLAAFYISGRMILPIMRLKNNILQMGMGEIPEINVTKEKNAVGLMTVAVQSLAESLRKTTEFAHKIGFGNLSAEFQPLSPKDELGNALLQMRNSLRQVDDENKKRIAFSQIKERINQALRENQEDIDDLADKVITVLVKSLNAYQGGMYFVEENDAEKKKLIRLHGSYAYEGVKKGKEILENEDGLVGQSIKDGETIYLRNISNNKKLIYSGFSSFSPSHVLIVPLKHQNRIIGAVEISGFTDFKDFEIEFLKGIGETIGTTIANVKANSLTRKLLLATREQASKLALKEEELRFINDELSTQSRLLQASEEELKQSNMELKEKARELQQKNDINEQAHEALRLKAKELELSNKYKSEFLANMSHELRTPLNSLLILAKLLEENKENNLSEKQREYAGIIHKSGKNLLFLINDILDLSKIEAGKLQIIPDETNVKQISDDIRMLFEEVANEKKIKYKVIVDTSVPQTFVSDKVRVEQVIKNLLSNAFKFTPPGGEIVFEIKSISNNINFTNPILKKAKECIAFSVKDNGIGISADKQAMIFEAFQQEDGSINRSYGGTGLGLSISKMLVGMLGGEMKLESEKGKGSTFYFYLPCNLLDVAGFEQEKGILEGIPNLPAKTIASTSMEPSVVKSELAKVEKLVLVVGDDEQLTQRLLTSAKCKKLKTMFASGITEGLQLVKTFTPDAIIDVLQPKLTGLTFGDVLKTDQNLSHIPVYNLYSGMGREENLLNQTGPQQQPMGKGDLENVISVLGDSGNLITGRVLIIEDAAIDSEIVIQLLKARFSGIGIDHAKTIDEAKRLMTTLTYDMVVLDLDLGNGPAEGLSFLEEIKTNDKWNNLNVVLFTGAELTDTIRENFRAQRVTVIQKESESFDKLLESAEKFLIKIESGESLLSYHFLMDKNLKGKRAVLIDGDMRNIYSLSNVLTAKNMLVSVANEPNEFLKYLDGKKPYDILFISTEGKNPDPFQVIHDFNARKPQCPIIAITQRSGIKEREKAILNGASDCIQAPIDDNKLYSLLQLWFYKH